MARLRSPNILIVRAHNGKLYCITLGKIIAMTWKAFGSPFYFFDQVKKAFGGPLGIT